MHHNLIRLFRKCLSIGLTTQRNGRAADLRSISAFVQPVLVAMLSILFCAFMTSAQANEVEVTTAKLEASEEGYRVMVGFAFELNSEIRSAINDGISVSFTAEVEVDRPRLLWFAEKTVRSNQTVKIQYDLWRRQYTASVNGGIKQSFPSLDEALNLVTRPRRWLIGDKKSLSVGTVYNVAVRLRLDSTQLSKPMLIKSLSSSDWRLASEWKRFSFKAEDK